MPALIAIEEFHVGIVLVCAVEGPHGATVGAAVRTVGVSGRRRRGWLCARVRCAECEGEGGCGGLLAD